MLLDDVVTERDFLTTKMPVNPNNSDITGDISEGHTVVNVPELLDCAYLFKFCVIYSTKENSYVLLWDSVKMKPIGYLYKTGNVFRPDWTGVSNRGASSVEK
jgi:hypothetical protein